MECPARPLSDAMVTGIMSATKEPTVKVSRNEPCPCGSGKKYKYCCYGKDSAKREAARIEESETDTATADETVTDDAAVSEEPKKQRASYQRDKGRSKFHSDGRGRGSSSQTRTQRGSQRGT